MVTVRLTGGMGNQMFQYAVVRAIAHQRRTSLALDVSAFPNDRHLRYSLGVFRIAEKLTDGGLMRIGWLRGLCHRVRIPGLPYVMIERGFTFDPSVQEAPGSVYLVGLWQSEKYFKEIEEIIRRDFCFKCEPEGQNAVLAAQIGNVNSVCVHVRRSDYVTNPSVNQVLGTCSLEYYRSAARFIAANTASPHYFVFSDDPDWARVNLNFDEPTTLVTHNGWDKGHEDMRLMALCRHHIIANSTFSWWGAWLSTSDGIVVAPRKWFNTSEYDARDLIPERWVRV